MAKPTRVILVCGDSDKSAKIHKLLDSLHEDNHITHILHDGTGAGLYAAAWSRQHADVAEIEMPVLSTDKPKTKAQQMLSFTKVRILAINAAKSHKELLKLAKEMGVKIRKVVP